MWWKLCVCKHTSIRLTSDTLQEQPGHMTRVEESDGGAAVSCSVPRHSRWRIPLRRRRCRFEPTTLAWILMRNKAVKLFQYARCVKWFSIFWLILYQWVWIFSSSLPTLCCGGQKTYCQHAVGPHSGSLGPLRRPTGTTFLLRAEEQRLQVHIG